MCTIIHLKISGGYVHLLHFLLILFALVRVGTGTREIKSPALDFIKHSIVEPIVHHGRTKREITSTRDNNGAHHSDVQVTVSIDGEKWVLELRLNEDLVTGGHTLQYQEGGNTVHHKPKKEELDLCHYSGSVRDKPQSWVAVSTCHGVRGVIFDGQKMRYIEPAQGPEIRSSHYLYDHNDLIMESQKPSSHYVERTRMADVDDITAAMNYTGYDSGLSSKRHAARYKRETDNTQVRGPYNANELSRYVELVLVADHREFRANGRDVRAMHSQLIQLANIMYSMYAPLNIYIALVGVVVWSERDKIRVTNDGDETLANFLKYRKHELVRDISHDNAHLLTHQTFGGVVGKALPHAMCKLESSGGVSVNFTDVIGLQAATIAHEMGHNLGMNHDESCAISECPDEKCIMSGVSTSVIPVHWSSCSVRALERDIQLGLFTCLRNKPKRLFNSPTCGNGFIEPGEQCDCGITAGGGINPCHACCHPDTCMLRRNATCSAGACCDLTTCRPMSAGTVCRSAARECDLPEYCSGHSEYCPDDVYKMDSVPCGVGHDEAFCMHGACRSHSGQCRLLWGDNEASRSHSECYIKNTEGTKDGYCGYEPTKQIYTPCASSDILCGLLQCHSEEYKLAPAAAAEDGAGADVSSYVRNRVRFDCYIAKFSPRDDNEDLAMVPDGAKCGHEMMCVKQKCQSVEVVQEEISRRWSSVCPSNCSGHGVCNSEGHCHCEVGFAPPLCATYGAGGSVDSGPATRSSGSSVDFRSNSNPNGGSVNFRPTIKPSGSSVNFRPTIRPSDSSDNYRPTIRPSSGSVNFRPTIRPSGGSVNFRPTIKPSGSSVNFRPTIRLSDSSDNYRPTIRPSGGSVNFRPTIRPSGSSVNFRPTIRPSGGSVNFRPTIRPSDGSVNLRPTIGPSDGSVNFRPTIEPSGGSINFRPNISTSGGSVNIRPPIRPISSSANFRPTVRPSRGPVNFRPPIRPSGRSGNFRPTSGVVNLPTIRPNDGFVNFRTTIRPNGGFVNFRTTIRPNVGFVNFRTTIRPNGGFINFRTTTRPNGGFVNFRTTIRPNGGFVNFRTTIRPSGGFVDSVPTRLTATVTTDSTAQRNFMIAMYVIFLGIIPSITILLFLIYYSRHNALVKKIYTKYIACCNGSFVCKTMTKIKNHRQETDKSITEKPTLFEPVLKKPAKNITKDNIQIVYNNVNNPDKPELNNNEDYLQTAINKVTSKPVVNINDKYIQIAINDVKQKPELSLKPVKPVLNINIDDNIHTAINKVKLKPVKPVSKPHKDNIPIATNNFKLTPKPVSKPVKQLLNINIEDMHTSINNVKLKPVKPVLKPYKDNIPIATTSNNFKLTPEPVSQPVLNINIDNIQTINNVKLKPVKTEVKPHRDIIPIATNNFKLTPEPVLKPVLNINIDDMHTAINNVKLKPVNPLISKPKSLTKGKSSQ